MTQTNGDYLCCLRENQLKVEGQDLLLSYNCEGTTFTSHNSNITTTSDNNTRTMNDPLLLPTISQLNVNNESDKQNIQSNPFTTNDNPLQSAQSNKKVMDQSYQDLQASLSQDDVNHHICALEFLSGFPVVSNISLFDRFLFMGFRQIWP